MKKLLVFTMVLSSFVSYGQSSIKSDTLFVSKCNDILWTKQYNNFDRFMYIKFEDDSVLKIGDKMKLNKVSYTGSNGTMTYVPKSLEGKDIIIKDLKIIHTQFSKYSPVHPYITFENDNTYFMVYNINSAIQNREISK
jgi:hypothetical protein